MDIDALRQQFPALEQTVHQHALVYLDNAATSQKPHCVLDAMAAYYQRDNANVHRGNHQLANRATQAFEDARQQVASFINAPSSNNIVWTRGTTEAINLVAQSWGRSQLEAGDEIILSTVEHHANIVPWQLLAEEKSLTLKIIPLEKTTEGYWQLDMTAYQQLLGPKTRLVCLSHVSNALGLCNPVKHMTELAHQAGATVLIDGAQAVAHLEVDVQALDCDFYAFSGHKAYGPTGIGVLYGKAELLDSMPPWQGGGEMISEVRFDSSRFQPPPFRFEAGTPAIAEAIGLARALQFIQSQDRSALQQHESQLLCSLKKALAIHPEIDLLDCGDDQVGAVSFTVKGHHHSDIAHWLDQQGIAIRTGHHCAMPLMQRLNIQGTLRASLAMYSNQADCDALLKALDEALHHNQHSNEVADHGEATCSSVFEMLKQQNDWQSRYRQLLLLGKQLPRHPELQQPQFKVDGCESQTWLSLDFVDNKIRIKADSDAKIIRGLLALTMDMVNDLSPEHVLALDFEQHFSTLSLQQHLSPSRGNGLLAITKAIQAHCRTLLNQP